VDFPWIPASGGSDSRNGLSRHIRSNYPVLVSNDHKGWLRKVGLSRFEGHTEVLISGDIPDSFGDSGVGHVIVTQHADDGEVDANGI
jgi:hypothetical protein